MERQGESGSDIRMVLSDGTLCFVRAWLTRLFSSHSFALPKVCVCVSLCICVRACGCVAWL